MITAQELRKISDSYVAPEAQVNWTYLEKSLKEAATTGRRKIRIEYDAVIQNWRYANASYQTQSQRGRKDIKKDFHKQLKKLGYRYWSHLLYDRYYFLAPITIKW